MFIVKGINWDLSTVSEEDALRLPSDVCINTYDINPEDYGLIPSYTAEDILNCTELCDDIMWFLSDEYNCRLEDRYFDTIEVPEEQTYNIVITQKSNYVIHANSLDQAKFAALDLFDNERPNVDVYITDQAEPDFEL